MGILTPHNGVCTVSSLFLCLRSCPKFIHWLRPTLRLFPARQAQADAYHLALAAWHGLDYLVSWNCTHVVSGRVRMIVEEVNAEFGIRTPIICTPEELMEVA